MENQPHAVDRYGSEVIRLHEVVERRLAESPYIAGDEYTIADMALFPGLKMVNIEGEDRSGYTNMNRWLDDIAARPAVIRAREALKSMTLTGGDGNNNFTEEQNDELFGRGKFSRLAAHSTAS